MGRIPIDTTRLTYSVHLLNVKGSIGVFDLQALMLQVGNKALISMRLLLCLGHTNPNISWLRVFTLVTR